MFKCHSGVVGGSTMVPMGRGEAARGNRRFDSRVFDAVGSNGGDGPSTVRPMKAPARRTESANPGCRAAYGLFRSQTLPCLVSCLVLGSTGCMVGPDPTPPTTVNPDSWHAELVEGVSRERVDPGAWWKRFDDPMLVELIVPTLARPVITRGVVDQNQIGTKRNADRHTM